jgi:low affinity Fe/Cu permease
MTKDKKCRVRSQEWFRKFACGVADCVGASWAFGIALILILGWGVTGPLFHFSDTWQLVINTATTIVTFLMVFLIQNTQNRDAKAIHLKLDELIRSTSKARNALVNLENLNDDELANLQAEFERLQKRAKLKQPEEGDNRREELTAAKANGVEKNGRKNHAPDSGKMF